MQQNVAKYRSHGMTLNWNKDNSGRQRTVISEENNDLLRNVLENNPNMTRICIEKYGRPVE